MMATALAQMGSELLVSEQREGLILGSESGTHSGKEHC